MAAQRPDVGLVSGVVGHDLFGATVGGLGECVGGGVEVEAHHLRRAGGHRLIVASGSAGRLTAVEVS
ncbi:MAG: hypothetical protein ACXVXF_11660, partial [Mycobacteriaceae bacterium]